MKRAYADTSYGQIHYMTEGDGPPLLLLHSSPNSSQWYSRVIPHLSDDYRVIAPDTLGFGNSDPLPDEVSMLVLAESLVALLDELDIEESHVLGLHTGNKIGVAMAAKFPDRVDRFVLCGQPHSIIPDEEERNAVIRRYGSVEDSIREFQPTTDGAHHLKEWGSLHAQVADYWWNADVLSGERFSRSALDRLATKVLDRIQARDSMVDVYNANFEYDWSGDLPRIEARTLILELAEIREVAEHGYQGERLTELISDSEWVAVDGADDGIFYDSPEEVATYVNEFLRR